MSQDPTSCQNEGGRNKESFIFAMFLFDRSHFSIKVNTEKWVFAMTII